MGKSFATLMLVALLGACEKEEPPPPPRTPPPKPPVDKSAWKEIETPVPVGQKLACDALFPAEKLAAAAGRKLEVIDDSARDPTATSVCHFVTVDKKGKRGDELCMVTLGCWSQWSVADVRKRCESQGAETTTDRGALTCVQTVRAGDKQRHVITVLEPDTRCRVVVNAGVYVYDVNATLGCARAVVDLLDLESLKQ